MLHSIHALRFLAASAVVVHHTGVSAAHGNIMLGAAGVDLFFVISGVVIGSSTRQGMPVSEFLTRRFIRIFPLYWIATAAVIAFAYALWRELPSPGALAHSVFLVPPTLSSAWFPLYDPAWTLVFELFFYLVFAACLWSGRHAKLVCAISLIIVAVALSAPTSPSIYRSGSGLLLEFIAGLLIAELIARQVLPGRWLGALLLGAALLLFARNAVSYGEAREIGWGIPAALMVFGALGFDGSPVLRHWLIVLGGNASYAIYLFHGTLGKVIATVFYWNGLLTKDHPELYAIVLIPGSVLLGMVIYLAVDKPLLSLARRSTSAVKPLREVAR